MRDYHCPPRHTEESERNAEIRARYKSPEDRGHEWFTIGLVVCALMLGFIAGIQFANWTFK